MKLRTFAWLPLLAAVCGFTSLLHADLTLVEHIDGMDQNMDKTIRIKAGSVRVDASLDGTATSMIVDKSGGMINLMPDEKSYMRITSRMIQEAREASEQRYGTPLRPSGAASPALTPTGGKDKISGYACEEYTASAIPGIKMTVWLTKAVPDYQNALKEMAPAFNQGPLAKIMRGGELDMATLPGFPIRRIEELPQGETVTITTLSVSAKPIADSEFAIPSDYKEKAAPPSGPPVQPAPDAAAPASDLPSLHADVTIVEHVDGMGQDTDTSPMFGAGKSTDLTWMFKAGHVRFDISTANSIIMDLKSGETIIMTHAGKSYANLRQVEETVEHWYGVSLEPPALPKDSGMPLARTGKKDTISGYAAEEYTCTAAGKKTTLWLSKAVPDYANILKEMAAAKGPMAGATKGAGEDVDALPGFPMRTVDELKPGEPLTTTVVSISYKPIADSEFKIPADYKPLTP